MKRTAVNMDADSGNDGTNEILQEEKSIDPGNEHSHNTNKERNSANNTKHDTAQELWAATRNRIIFLETFVAL